MPKRAPFHKSYPSLVAPRRIHVREVEPLNMDAGLSDRMLRAVEEFAPSSSKQHTSTNASSIIDLSTAQNETLRPELVEFFKSTVEDKATSDVSLQLQDQAITLLFCTLS